MMSKMDEIFKKVLNDRDIFDSPYDTHKKEHIPKLFEENDWKKLGELFKNGKKDEYEKMIQDRINQIKYNEQNADDWRKTKIDELEKRAKWLINAYDNKQHLLKQLFETLEWYGLVECYLPNMNDYGKVIERYDKSIVIEYFMDKIKKSQFPRNRALEKVLNYVVELYDAGVPREKIAFFVRKLNSLTKYWEVIK
ncbi:conserved protein of unknown function [Methanocaldococcus lauensis]|uniref:Uncharacterized protein n=1 Tax=Methanocaldococcus lauensis TaxID=2546128 RepID=A0A8D6PS01_9EURY|nr:hypothetical protein [Methanocaldococcus lauensis]CAB3287436.1 conserved protein of unknown function [Methanocaldococcus lauensis]